MCIDCKKRWDWVGIKRKNFYFSKIALKRVFYLCKKVLSQAGFEPSTNGTRKNLLTHYAMGAERGRNFFASFGRRE